MLRLLPRLIAEQHERPEARRTNERNDRAELRLTRSNTEKPSCPKRILPLKLKVDAICEQASTEHVESTLLRPQALNPEPKRPTARTEREDPNMSVSRTDSWIWSNRSPWMEQEDPSRRLPRIDRELPILRKSNMLTCRALLPIRQRERTDTELPKADAWMQENVEPSWIPPKVERLIPTLSMLRREIELPRCEQFRTENLSEHFPKLRKDILLPKKTSSMTDSVPPIRRPSVTESDVPRFKASRTEVRSPNRANVRTERQEPILTLLRMEA
jgi:hypothetical protein